MNHASELNAEQVRALAVVEGPLLLLAGAGSGKTKTLTHRIAMLITEQKLWPDEILAVTFTNKAAREMRERLWKILADKKSVPPRTPRGASQALGGGDEVANSFHNELEGSTPPRTFMPWMGTFHSICVRLLRADGRVINIAPNFVIYDDDDRTRLVKQAMKECSVTDKQIKPRQLVATISKAKNDMVMPDEFAAAATLPYQQLTAQVYRRYETLRQQANALDFDDILLEAVRMLRESLETRTRWQQKFRHILVDEYQDTNAAQYALIRLLVNETRNICVVGDDWQSIYSWRGADFTNILNFERDFPGAVVIKLEQNYRSTQAILDAAHAVIVKNDDRTDKKLWTNQKGGAPVEIHSVYDEAEEAYRVAERIGSQVGLGARRYDDFAVLYRTNAQSYPLERALMQHRIPYQIVGGVRFFDRREIKDVIAYLRLLYQPHDTVSFLRIANVPARGLGAVSLERFGQWRATQGMDIISALEQAATATELTPKSRKAFAELGAVLRSLEQQLQSGDSPGLLIEQILEKTGYMASLRDGSSEGEDREANLGALVSDARSFVSVADFLEETSLMSSVDEASRDDTVTLMTLHAAKGLEFPVIWMVGLEEGLLPHARVFDGTPADLEEERRLCYVGMTRAREELHMSFAGSRMQFGQRGYSQPSRFLDDIGYRADHFSLESPKQYDEYDPIMPFDIGDQVRSLQFGEGEVIDIDGMAVTVAFASGTTKKLNVEYARLQKLA